MIPRATEIINKLKQKHILLLFIPLGLLLLMIISIIVISLSSSPEQNPKQGKPSNVTITPEVITTNSSISTYTPQDKAIDVSIFTTFCVSFTTPVSPAEKNSISLDISPAINGQQTWSEDNKTVSISPSSPLKNAQDYIANLSYKGRAYTWTFQTVTIERMSQEDQIRAQERADANFRTWEQDVQQNYPWLDSLPLQTDNYFFYFDIDKKAFFGELYPKTSSTQPIDSQVNAFKQEILIELSRLSIPTTQFPINWDVQPE